MPRMIFVLLSAIFAFSCSESAADRAKPFADCWRFEGVRDGLYLSRFTALIYPKSGVVSYNPKCPSLRLAIKFYDQESKLEEELFKKAELNGLKPTAFSGEALISIDEIQRDPQSLHVTVKKLTRARLLTPQLNEDLAKEMSKAR